MNKDKTVSGTNRSVAIAGLVILGASTICVLVAGLTKLLAWPAALFIIESAFVFVLLGGTGASLRELIRRTRYTLLKVSLILIAVAYVLVVSLFLVFRFLPAKPEMSALENNTFELVSILSGIAGLSAYEIKSLLTGQATEQPKKGKIEMITESLLAKLSTQGILIGGGTFMLIMALVMYAGPSPSNPHLLPTVVAGGASCLVVGIAEWIAPRFPRLAFWLRCVGVAFAVALIYFWVRMFFYG